VEAASCPLSSAEVAAVGGASSIGSFLSGRPHETLSRCPASCIGLVETGIAARGLTQSNGIRYTRRRNNERRLRARFGAQTERRSEKLNHLAAQLAQRRPILSHCRHLGQAEAPPNAVL